MVDIFLREVYTITKYKNQINIFYIRNNGEGIRISPRPSRKGPKKKWKTIQLPKDLIQRIDKIIATHDLGYTSRNEFIKEAIRFRTEQIREQKKIKV